MARKIAVSPAPARGRVGLPIVADGSRERPLLHRLDDSEGSCNNGCLECLTHAVDEAAADLAGKHVVIRHREPTLRRDLAEHVASLRARGAIAVTLVTNGRMLVYPTLTRGLVRAGVSRIVVKLFGPDAAAHDSHTRSPGSFDQAREGIAVARDAGAEVLVAFPLGTPDPALARELTARDPVNLPGPEIETHPNEFRYDVVELQDGVAHPWWSRTFFPMVHVHTGPVCNIRCTYCNVHGGDDQRVYARDYVERMIDEAARNTLPRQHGIPTLDLIGGEPTLHPDLPALIRRGREAGFAQVFICTNGVLLLRPGYLDSLIAAGLTGVRFSFHDHRADSAAALADVSGLGTRYPDVARMLLARRDLHVHLYRIVLASTIDALPDYLRFIVEHDHTGKPIDLTFGMPSMRGRLFENRHLYPALGELREKLAAAIALARELGIEPLIHHAPACLVPDHPMRSSALHIRPMQVEALAGDPQDMNFEGDARFGEACTRCDGRRLGCNGLPAAYWDADPAAAEAWLRPLSLPEPSWPTWR